MSPEDDAPATTTTDLETGEVLGGLWQLEDKIGEGGMGRVFRARDLKLSRQVAVKALSVKNIDDETVARFEREAQVMGRLDHPGIVTLYGVGRTRGVPWLAMKFLEGQGLWAVLDAHGGRLPPSVLLPILRQLLVALGYIHERGLIHRDLKPSNIHVGPGGKTTLLDLGLARGHKSSLTKTGVIWGTPDYMAPEQIVGERTLDGRADLYSLTVVCYRMLYGRAPFEEADEHELMRAHLMKPRPDLSVLMPELSPLLGAALQQGLAIRPEDRFQTAEEMLAALEPALSTEGRTSANTAVTLPPVRTTPEPDAPKRPSARGLDATAKAPARQREFEVTKPEGRRITGELSTGAEPKPTRVEPRPSRPQPPRPSRPKAPAPVDDPGSTVLTDDDGPDEPDTAPSDPVRAPLPREDPPLLPVYLTPPFLIGGAVLILLLGIILGKLI